MSMEASWCIKELVNHIAEVPRTEESLPLIDRTNLLAGAKPMRSAFFRNVRLYNSPCWRDGCSLVAELRQRVSDGMLYAARISCGTCLEHESAIETTQEQLPETVTSGSIDLRLF